MAALVFLDANGVKGLPGPRQLEAATLAAASGNMPKSELTEWFRRQLGKKGPPKASTSRA